MDIEIRLITKEDIPQIWELIDKNRDRLRRYFPKTVDSVKDSHAAKRFVEQKIRQALHRDLFYFVVVLHQSEIIGNVTLKQIDWTVPKGELAYFVDKDHEGKGYISMALRYMVKYCFDELGMEKLYVKIAFENMASKKMVQKNGFLQEGFMRKEYRTGEGKLVDVAYYGLLKSEMQPVPQATSRDN